MKKDNHTTNYNFPPVSLLATFVNDQKVVEEGYQDQDGVCNFITNYFASVGFVCNLLGVDYGFNITEYKLQLLSDREKDDGITYKNLFDKRRFYIEFIRKLYSYIPARTASIKILSDRDAPAEIVLLVRVPNAFVRSICLSYHLQQNKNKFNYLFACDKYANPIDFDVESGLSIIAGSERDKIFQTLRTSIAGITYKYAPSELKVILYDVSDNLSVFNGIPHLQFGKNINYINAFYELLQWIEKDYNKILLKVEKKDKTDYEKKQLIISGLMQKGYDYQVISKYLKDIE